MDNALKVCLLNDSFPPVIDGVANVVVNYADYIHRRCGGAVVATPHYPNAVDDYPFPVVRYPSINTVKSFGYRTGIPFCPGAVNTLIKSDFNVIHSHCPFISTLVARTLRSTVNAPIVLTYHTKFDIDIKNAVELGFLQSAAIKFIISNIEACDEVWVVSEGAGENLRSLGYAGDYTVMENGVDFPRGPAPRPQVEAVGADYGLTEDVPVFLYVGRMVWYKGVRTTIDGLCRAKAQGARFKMLFVGDGADIGEMKRCAAALGLSDVCTFTGAIKDRGRLRALFSRADMFLFPSTFDTNGIVVREAAACGLASVLIRDSCAAEGIVDGRHGILISDNARAMATAVARVCGDVDAARRMGRTAMEEIYLSWDDAVARACARYPSVIESFNDTLRDGSEINDLRLFKLAGDIERTLERLRLNAPARKRGGRRHRRLRLK